jgi:glycosyltransferase involved in cell wall biosynthesis
MKVLYISYDGMTDPLGQSQVIPYLKGLSEMGHMITLLSCEKKERFQKQGMAIKDLLNAAGITWVPVPYSSLPSILSKKLNLLRIFRKANTICKSDKPHIVHCRSYMAATIGLRLKKQYNVKFIFDMRGFWADERIDGGIWTFNNFIHKRLYSYFKKKEIEFLLNADYTISLTQNAKNEILSWKALQQEQIKIRVIPCCADLEHFSSSNVSDKKINELRNELQLSSNHFVISYLGSIGTWYMLDEMLDFFKVLLNKKPEAVFLFITTDSKDHIYQKASEKNISQSNIKIVASSRKDVPAYLLLSAISIYFIKPLYSKKASSPTKTAEILAMGVPVITNSGIGDSDYILKESGAGLIIDDFTASEYSRVIEQFDVILKSDRSFFRKVSKNHFSLEEGVKCYNEVYKKLE